MAKIPDYVKLSIAPVITSNISRGFEVGSKPF